MVQYFSKLVFLTHSQCLFTVKNRPEKTENDHLEPDIFFDGLEMVKSSFDALDGLYGADRHRVVKAVVNNSC